MTPKSVVQQWLRRLNVRTGPHLKQHEHLCMTGLYKSWSDAETSSSGYHQDNILAKTLSAALAVKTGKARYERDSVLFQDSDLCYPMLALALWLAGENAGHLKVLDFGGSLASKYFQHLRYFKSLKSLRWRVVEQSAVVKAGNENLKDEQLSFHENYVSACIDGPPDLIILGAVLQYLATPLQTLSTMFSLGAKSLFLDRTPFWAGAQDLITVQHVPESIYRATYPCWIFSKPCFMKNVSPDYTPLGSYVNEDWMPAPVKYAYEGHIYVKN